ncbi:glycosyltransferase family 2 protein [Phocaeicola sp.]
MHKVTIAIPLYNTEEYIKEALSSALNQTLEHIEILIINDCSTDNSLAVVEEMNNSNARDDISVRIISLPANKGIGAVRNISIAEADGKYLFFLDSDDYISEDCLELMYDKAENIQADIVFSSSETVYKDHTEKAILADRTFTEWGDFQKFCYTQRGKYQNTVWNKLYNLDFIKTNNLHFKEINRGEDCLFLNALVPCVRKCTIIPNITYSYRIRENSLCQYNARDVIPIEEIRAHLYVASEINKISYKYKTSPFAETLIKEHLNFSVNVIFVIFDKWNTISTPVPATEIKEVLAHPCTLQEIWHFKQKRYYNIWLYFFAKLPFCVIKSSCKIYYKLIKFYRKMRR